MERFTGLLGIAVLLAIAWGLSEARARVPWRVLVVGILLQFAIAVTLLHAPGVAPAYNQVAEFFVALIGKADAGAVFVFGGLAEIREPWGFVFFAKVTSIIIFFAALMGVLYHLGVMQVLIAALAWCLRRTLGITGVEALCAASNLFVGQTEAPLCVKPYLKIMTRSQVMVIMTCGFATIAGSVLAAIVGYVGRGDPESSALIAKHLLTASVISAPGALVMAKVLVPETSEPPAEDGLKLSKTRESSNLLDAAATGTLDGLKLALNVAAMLIAFISLIAVVNWPLQSLGTSLEEILGLVFRPFAFLMGVPEGDRADVGSLIGLAVIATELPAYERLGSLIAEGEISERGRIIAMYALCGFANLPSIGIQIGGLSAMAPERRAEFAALGFRAMGAGVLACWMTACVASVVV